MDNRIPGLPDEIATVPSAPFSHTDPDAEAKRLAWRRWRYDVHVERTRRQELIHHHPELQPYELIKCSQHPAYYAAMWLRVFEPRWRVDQNLPILSGDDDDPDAEMEGVKKIIQVPHVPEIVSRDLRAVDRHAPNYDPALEPIFGYVPFICFADQVRVINHLLWSLTQSDEYADVVWSKSRGWGASWILCLLSLWGWSFSHLWPGAPPWNVLLLSRKEEYVDSKQQKSLFWKIRRLMRDMPPWMMPQGFNVDIHDQKGIIINPENGNEIGGESTNSNAGRGDRVTFAAIDEAAAVEGLLNKWSTLTETTDHRWACSTESFDQGTSFWDLRQESEDGVRPHVITTDWWENPLNDDAWIKRQEKRYTHDPDMFQQEVWRNPKTGSTWVYPWAAECRTNADYKPVSGLMSFIGVDPGYRDPTAIVAIQETSSNEYVVLDAYQEKGKESDFFAPMLKPSLFADIDPHWADKDFIEWTSPIDPTLTYVYKTREISFARTIDQMGVPRFIGDTYGETVIGATKDSVYSRWRRYGINVNPDRRTGDAVTTTIKQQRTFKGRQGAMNELSRRWRFADTDGAKMCLKAWQNSKFKAVPDRAQQSEPTEPEHGSDSHLRTAGEFVAAYIKHRGRVLGRDLQKPVRSSMRHRSLMRTALR